MMARLEFSGVMVRAAASTRREVEEGVGGGRWRREVEEGGGGYLDAVRGEDGGGVAVRRVPTHHAKKSPLF
jgi:hypothetical protein